MIFVDKLSIIEFKGRVREEARRLNLTDLGQGLSVEISDLDTVQANYARSNHQRIFPPRKINNNIFSFCRHCEYRNHFEQDCHKRIVEEYNVKQARKFQNKRDNDKGRSHRGDRGRYDSQAANLANDNVNNSNANNGTALVYNAIFDDFAYCCKVAANG